MDKRKALELCERGLKSWIFLLKKWVPEELDTWQNIKLDPLVQISSIKR